MFFQFRYFIVAIQAYAEEKISWNKRDWNKTKTAG
jgi:hypothetical protein